MKTYFYTFTLNKVDKYFIFILLCTCSTFAFVMFARGNGLALSLPCLIFPDERSDELTGRKQMCNLQPINLSFSLSLLCFTLPLSLSCQTYKHTYTALSLCEALPFCCRHDTELSLITLSEDKHAPLNLSDFLFSFFSSSLAVCGGWAEKISIIVHD